MKNPPVLIASPLLAALARGALTPDADNGGLVLPPGFRAIVVALARHRPGLPQ